MGRGWDAETRTCAWYQGMGQQVGPCAQSCPILQAAFTLIQFSFSSLTAHLLGCGEDWSPVSLLMLSACILSPALTPSCAPELCRRLLDGHGHPYHRIKLLPSPACHGISPCGRSLLISNPTRGAGGCSWTWWEEVPELLGLRCYPGAHFASGVSQLCSVHAANEPYTRAGERTLPPSIVPHHRQPQLQA